MAAIKLGDLLVKAKVLREEQLTQALAHQKRQGGKLGEILVQMDFVSEEVIVKALSRQLGLPIVDLFVIQAVPPQVRLKLSSKLAKEMTVLPLQLRDDGKTLVIAMADPLNVSQLEKLKKLTGCRLLVQLAGKTAIERAYARFYDESDSTSEEGDGSHGSFRLVDAQGRTVVRTLAVEEPPPHPPVAKAPPPKPVAPPMSSADMVSMLKTLESSQRQEVSAIKAVIEIMIEKGFFTREEYLAKIKRSGQ